MRHAAISKVYAGALLSLAQEKGQLQPLLADVAELGQLLDDDAGFLKFFESPELGFEQKRRVLEKLTTGAQSDLTLRFLLLLVRKRREAMLGPILEMFRHLMDEKEGRIRGRLMSARPLDQEALAAVESLLGKVTGKEVRLKAAVADELMAGMVLHLADKTYDGSLKTRLNRLRAQLMTAQMGKE